MAPTTRGIRNVLVEREEEPDEASTSEDDGGEELEEEEVEDDDEEADELEDEAEEVITPREIEKKKIKVSLRGSKMCKVCKKTDHEAGFVGSVYMDCPNKPCYLCKEPGHTTATCPHRTAPEHGVVPASRRLSGGIIDIVHLRQLSGLNPPVKRLPEIPNRIDAAVLRLHSRRITTLEFHPTSNSILLSGDKKGQVAVWNFEKIFEKTVYDDIHRAIVAAIRFDPERSTYIFSAACDGKLCSTDFETGVPQTLVDLNPLGWQGDLALWRSFYSMDLNAERHVMVGGDDIGNLHLVDSRSKEAVAGVGFAHKKGSKVVSVHCNPMDSNLVITGGNDHMARIWDLRKMAQGAEVGVLVHSRVVNSAYFSPVTGTKILTTCQDNRLRVWDYVLGDLSQASRELVHSHDFNRYLTAFRAEWDPKDPSESLIVCGRYISDDYNGVALHPIDFLDASTGAQVAAIVDPNLTTISPVNKPHPRLDILATGSSRSIFIWKPAELEVDEETDRRRKEGGGAGPSGRGTTIQIYEVDDGGSSKRKKTGMKGKGAKGKVVQEEEEEEGEEEAVAVAKKKWTGNSPAFKVANVKSSMTRGGRRKGKVKQEVEEEEEEEEEDDDNSGDKAWRPKGRKGIAPMEGGREHSITGSSRRSRKTDDGGGAEEQEEKKEEEEERAVENLKAPAGKRERRRR